jgi:16S rRNA (cytidine1402-2'-O)-methyltransferase
MPAGRLFVVATPLGNLEDLSPRALRILREASVIACEDTRRTAHLLKAYGVATPTTSYFEHNERWKGRKILDTIEAGRDAALVSDAGTPAVSDPGFRLVREAYAAGVPVIPIPGPSAVIAALCVSGLPSDRFLFVGFLPARSGPRRRAIEELKGRQETLVLYESPLRLGESLADMLAVWGDRESFLAREATKLHEEYLRGRLSELRQKLMARAAVRGEVTLVVAGCGETPLMTLERPEALFERLVAEGRTRREAVKEVARLTGLSARDVYRRVLPQACADEKANDRTGWNVE